MLSFICRQRKTQSLRAKKGPWPPFCKEQGRHLAPGGKRRRGKRRSRCQREEQDRARLEHVPGGTKAGTGMGQPGHPECPACQSQLRAIQAFRLFWLFATFCDWDSQEHPSPASERHVRPAPHCAERPFKMRRATGVPAALPSPRHKPAAPSSPSLLLKAVWPRLECVFLFVVFSRENHGENVPRSCPDAAEAGQRGGGRRRGQNRPMGCQD